MKLFALSLALCVRASFSADAAADLQKKFVGSWKLISIDGPNQQPINGTPFGIIMYDNTGHMAVQIVRGHRPTFPNGPAKATDTAPGQIGQDNIRYFELKGNRLTLSVANNGKGGRIPFKDTTRHLTWEKLPNK